MIRNAHFYNLNEGRTYPLDDRASALSDAGVRLPSNIITDLRLRWPKLAGEIPFISAVTVTPGAVSVTIQAADVMDNSDEGFTPIAVITVPIQELEEGRVYPLLSQYEQTFGYITFGSGIQKDYVGRFSTPNQSLIASRAAKFHNGLPVKSMGKLYNSTAMTGVVQLLGDSPIEVVKESREIGGIERDVIVVRLVNDPTSSTAGSTEQSVFQQFSGPCDGRSESDTCGDPKPIEFINAIGPDCDGLICINFKGISVVGRNLDDCGIVVDLPFSLTDDACVAPYLPDATGKLPSEVDPVSYAIAAPFEPSLPPDESISDSLIVMGELPYCDSFDFFTAESFVVKTGQWVFAEDDSPEEICTPDIPQWDVTTVEYACNESQSLSEGVFEIDYLTCNSQSSEALPSILEDSSYASEGIFSASQRNVTVWQGFDVTTFHRVVTTDVKLMPGPSGAKHNAGLVINYRPHVTASNTYVYYIAELDYDSQSFRIRRWNGTAFQNAVLASVPGIMLESWYRIVVEIEPGTGEKVYITARLIGIDDPTVSVVIGPLLTNNYNPEDGYFGFGTDRSLSRFSYFHIAELI